MMRIVTYPAKTRLRCLQLSIKRLIAKISLPLYQNIQILRSLMSYRISPDGTGEGKI